MDLCAQGGDILQDCCDLLAWPLEQIILSGWMKQLTGSIFGSRAGGNKTKSCLVFQWVPRLQKTVGARDQK